MNPTEAMIEQIEAAGKRFTFNVPLGEKGQAVANLVKRVHLEPVVPFISTPANVMKEMVRMTPAAPMVGEWRADFAAGGTRAQKAMAEISLGIGISAFTISLAQSGHISGGGDPDPNKRRVAVASGWQPYSIKVNGTWYSYQRIQPVGTLIGLAADMAEVWHRMDSGEQDKVPKMIGAAFAQAVTNQIFLQGFANVIGAITEPDRKMPRFIQGLAGGFIPSALAQTAALLDPYQREVQSIRDAVQNRIPGAREVLTPARDPFGEPVPSPERIGGVLPFAVKAQSEDKVRQEAARLKLSVSPAPRSLHFPDGHIDNLGKVELTQPQRDVFADVSGHLAHQVLSTLVNSPDWDATNDVYKKRVMELVFQKTRKAGEVAALSDEQRQKEIQRIVGAVEKKISNR